MSTFGPKEGDRLIIATGRYFDTKLIQDSGLVSLGHTVGQPRVRLGYELAGNVGILAPYGLRDVEDQAEFEKLYRARLERFGAEKIRRLLASFAEAHDAPGVVLLCYEDLSKPGSWCHRRVFARWWEEKTGQHVPELN